MWRVVENLVKEYSNKKQQLKKNEKELANAQTTLELKFPEPVVN